MWHLCYAWEMQLQYGTIHHFRKKEQNIFVKCALCKFGSRHRCMHCKGSRGRRVARDEVYRALYDGVERREKRRPLRFYCDINGPSCRLLAEHPRGRFSFDSESSEWRLGDSSFVIESIKMWHVLLLRERSRATHPLWLSAASGACRTRPAWGPGRLPATIMICNGIANAWLPTLCRVWRRKKEHKCWVIVDMCHWELQTKQTGRRREDQVLIKSSYLFEIMSIFFNAPSPWTVQKWNRFGRLTHPLEPSAAPHAILYQFGCII